MSRNARKLGQGRQDKWIQGQEQSYLIQSLCFAVPFYLLSSIPSIRVLQVTSTLRMEISQLPARL